MTKKFSKWIAALLSLSLLVTMVAACGGDKPAAQPVLTGIEITSQPTKLKYVEGDVFNTSGMVVSAVYDNGEKKTVTDYTYSPSGALAIGTTEVVVTYKDKTSAVAITVAQRAISSIEVTAPPAKTQYVEGESFNKSGMKVVANYNDGTSMEITGYTVVPAGALTSDVTKVTLSYLGKTAEVEITVTQKTVTKLEITSEPSVKTYVEGQSFSTAGMVVKATFSDGTTSAVIGYTVTPSTLSLGDTQVTVSFGGKSVTQAVTVIAKAVSSVEITKNPTKTIYFDGESFDKTGMEVTAVYNDGDRKAVTDYTVNKTVLSLEDTFVTVSYEGKTVKCEITVTKAIESISVSKAPDKTTYVEGQKFDPAGMEITANYSDSTSGVITGWIVTNADKALAMGDTQVEIAYGSLKVNQLVTVIAKAVESIAVTKNPTKEKYVVGQSLVADGLQISATYNDGDVKVIPAQPAGGGEGYVLTAPESLSAGSNAVTVQYADKQTTFTVTAREVVSVTVTATDAFKSAYAEGETFDPAGLEMTAVLDDDDTVKVAYDKTGKDGFTCDTEKLLSSSDTSVTLTFKGKTATIDITVKGGFAVEAEKAVLISKSCESLRLFNDSPLASGGMYVGEVREGDKIRYEFTASKDGTASIYLRASSGDCKQWSSDGAWGPVVMNDVVIKDAVTAKMNGSDLTIPANAILKGGKTDDTVHGDKSLWFNWAQVKLENIAVKEGTNTFEITYIKGMNTDSIKVLFDGDVTGAPYFHSYTAVTVGGGKNGDPVYSSDTLTKHSLEFESVKDNPNADNEWKNQSNSEASGGGFVDGIKGGVQGFTFKINLAADDDNAVIDLVVACTNWDGSGNAKIEDIADRFQLRVNGIQVSFKGLSLDCKDSGNWTTWTSIVVSGIGLKAGENVIEYRKGTNDLPNSDVLNVWTSVELAA